MKKKLRALLFFCLLSSCLSAQTIELGSGFNENRLKMRVKQVDEFMERFNYEKDLRGNPVSNRLDAGVRKKYIFSLFNEDLLRQTNDSLLEVYADFANVVTNIHKPTYIDFTDNKWIAQCNCKVACNGKASNIFVFLKPEKIREYEYKWVIVGAGGDLLTLQPARTNPGIMISPTENELNFMNLPRISGKDNKDVVNYMSEDYTVNPVTVLNTLIYTGQLKIEYVNKVVYHFFQAPGYVFKVEHFERDSDNAGWLISGVMRLSQSEKENYRNNIINYK
ncbi:MAG: hypothetical protein LBT83_05350 [Tannerella sp.]|nr:hypothetical protein [Tannerella sp.]